MIDINSLYVGDCAEVMRTFPKGCVDLVVTSPPYDNLRDYKGYQFEVKKIIEQLYRVVKIGGVVVWVVGDASINNNETGTSFGHALFFKAIGFKLHDTMIYEKSGFNYPSFNRYHQAFEYMFVFSKGKLKTFNPIKDRPNKWGAPWATHTMRQKDGSLKIADRPFIKRDFGMRTNVWKYVSGYGFGHKWRDAHKHPATFPEKLAEDHILSWSNEGDLVLDPMCGSGTTCAMAKVNNRNYIGIDISEEYIKLAQERLNLCIK